VQASPFHEHDRGRAQRVLRRPARRSAKIWSLELGCTRLGLEPIANEPQFVRFEVLNSAHQLIAKAFIGLYPDNDENRSKGELVLNVVVPQIDKAENSAANLAVQSYYYRVERGQLSDLTASDRDAVELSLDATDHSLSRAALQQVLDQIPSGDGA
jgi:hypothetical protein